MELSAQRLVNNLKSRSGEGLCRAGSPQCTALLTETFPGEVYTGYYTGGGAALSASKASFCRGEPRKCDEGTFGVDYAPTFSRVRLQWFHGRRYQAGEGQYEADRPHNPFAHFGGLGSLWRRDRH